MFNKEYDYCYTDDKTSCENEKGFIAALTLDDHDFYCKNIPEKLKKIISDEIENKSDLREVLTDKKIVLNQTRCIKYIEKNKETLVIHFEF